jgi:predicted transcriptional regulator
MKALTLRLPDELHARLVELAAREHRDLTHQIIHLLEEGERETRRRLAERDQNERDGELDIGESAY